MFRKRQISGDSVPDHPGKTDAVVSSDFFQTRPVFTGNADREPLDRFSRNRMTGLGMAFFHGAPVCTDFNQKQSETVGARHFFRDSENTTPRLKMGVNQPGSGQRAERVSVERAARAGVSGRIRARAARRESAARRLKIAGTSCVCASSRATSDFGCSLTESQRISRLQENGS